MKIFKTVAAIIAMASVVGMTSCRVTETIDPDLEIPGLGGHEYAKTELDYWLEETFLVPYNIEIVYRWDAVQFYSNVNKRLVPVDVEKVKPMMTTLSKVWFEPYRNVAPYGFLQKYTPKKVILAGSPEYASDGSSMVLGTAEGAVKIFLSNANAFNPSNKSTLKNYLHVIEHEFVHVLNQAVNYDPEFRAVTTSFYDPTGWTKYDYDNTEAYQRGFLSNYSMSSPDEDFAEVMSLLLVNGEDWFKNEVLPIAAKSVGVPDANPNAAADLQKKVDLVEAYLKTHFDIMLFDDDATGKKGFTTYVQEAMDYVINEALYGDNN